MGMMDFSKSDSKQSSIGTIIGAEAKVTGQIETRGAVRLDGELNGKIIKIKHTAVYCRRNRSIPVPRPI